MSTRFTPKAQNVLSYALQSAHEMGHTYIGSEHLLLGLLKEDGGVAAHYLHERGVSLDAVRHAIVQLTGVGTPSQVSPADMTPSTKKIIEASLYEAQQNGQTMIGTEHLLLSLLGERE